MTYSIEVSNLSKRYRKGRGLTNLRELLSFRRRAAGEQFHWAVCDVSFAVRPGEALGIIGPNGAGKTTILKMLSRVTKPTRGSVRVDGRFSALIELGAGFHPDLTGRENIFLNGTILGMRRDEIRRRFDEIVDFAGIGSYLDTPVKRYSSGMHARLGFAIAAHIDPDVLLVDEVLAVGDFAFQMKCHARMDELRAKGTSLIFVSHNFEAVRRVCNRGLVLYGGQGIYQGAVPEAIMAYSDAIRQAARAYGNVQTSEGGLSERVMSFAAEIEKIEFLDIDGTPVRMAESGTVATIALDVVFHHAVRSPVFAVFLRAGDGRIVYNTTTRWMGIETPSFAVGQRSRILFKVQLNLLEGEYAVGGDVAAADLSHYLDRREWAFNIFVTDSGIAQGVADLRAEFEIAPVLED